MEKRIATLIYGDNPHYLDHLAPISYFLNIPFITNEIYISNLCKKYYPKVKVLLIDNLTINRYVVENYDQIITCITKELFDKDFRFFQDQLKKEVKIIWTPHGFSDKGKTTYFFESLVNSQKIFVYGKKMLETLKEKNILNTIKNYEEIGNYRLKYYQEFKAFYKKIIKTELTNKLPKNKITILYAPTWQDYEKSTSFFNYYEKVLNQLPKKYNLIIKLHPNLIKENEIKLLILKEKNKEKNILFLDNFTNIYPLIDFVDIYLGDFSSIGYDFLYFKKPLFFLPTSNLNLSSSLYECGYLIKDNNIYKTIDSILKLKHTFESKKKALYSHVFKSNVKWEAILNNLQNS